MYMYVFCYFYDHFHLYCFIFLKSIQRERDHFLYSEAGDGTTLPPTWTHCASVQTQKAICDLLCTFMNFIWRQWITNPVFTVQNWSVFMLSLRTNNDLEGWHNRLNRHVNQEGPEPFYLLLTELYKESENIPLQARLLLENWMENFSGSGRKSQLPNSYVIVHPSMDLFPCEWT